MRNKIILAVLALIFLAVGWKIYSFVTAPIIVDNFNEPIDVISEPIQTEDTTTMLTPMTFGKNKIFFTTKAAYKLSGILVSKHRYYKGDIGKLSPYDYAVCWGQVPEWFPYIKFSQVSRFCNFKFKQSAPIDLNYVQSHMSNNHMIPSNKNIRNALKYGKKYQKVQIEGYLVNVMVSDVKHGTIPGIQVSIEMIKAMELVK